MTHVRFAMLLMDSCAHPTSNGEWLSGRIGVTHAELVRRLRICGYSGALAIGLPGVGGYQHERFLQDTICWPELTPVAALCTVASRKKVEADISHIASLGFQLIKIHPRLLGYERCIRLLPTVLEQCVIHGLSALICTYPEHRSPIDSDSARRMIVAAIDGFPDANVVALHAGVLDPTPFVELAASRGNLLLDFSFTMMRYEGLTIGTVAEIASAYPTKVCFGSDTPEWTYPQVASVLGRFAHLVSPDTFTGFVGSNLKQWVDDCHDLEG